MLHCSRDSSRHQDMWLVNAYLMSVFASLGHAFFMSLQHLNLYNKKRAHLQLIYTCSFKHWPNEGTHFKVMTCADVNNHKCKTKTYKQYVCGMDCVTLLYDPCYINDYNWLKKYNTMINFRLYATRDWSTWIFLWFYL